MEHRDLNERRRNFAELIARGACATDAYLAAGYRPTSRASAQAASSRLRHAPPVAAYVRQLRAVRDAASRKKTIRSIRRQLVHLTRIIQMSAGDIPRPYRRLIEYQRTFKNGGCAVRLPCKLTALRLHSKLAGHLDFIADDLSPDGLNSQNKHVTT